MTTATPSSELGAPRVATPTAPPEPRPPALVQVTSPLTVAKLGSDQPASSPVGLGFLDPATGSFEVWAPPNAADDFTTIQSSTDGSVIEFAPPGESGTQYLVVRSTGSAFTLPHNVSVDLSAATAAAVPAWYTTSPAGDEYRLVMYDLVRGGARLTGISYARGGYVLLSPDLTTAFLLEYDQLTKLDVATGASAGLVSGLPDHSYIEPRPDGLGFALVRGNVGVAASAEYDWNGVPLTGLQFFDRVSPDGRLVARAENRVTFRAPGLGEYPTMAFITVMTRGSSSPVARILGAGPIGWLADSNGLLVNTGQFHTAVYRLDGKRLGDFAPVGILNSPLAPSPVNADLVGDPSGITWLSTGERRQVVLPEQRAIHSAWLPDGSAFAMTWGPIAGKDFGVPKALFPVLFELPPFEDVGEVRVAGGGCLNLRESPATSARSLGCFPDGTVAQLTDAPDPYYDTRYDKDGLGPMAVGGVRDDAGDVWLHVRTPDGQSGWMAAPYLQWPIGQAFPDD